MIWRKGVKYYDLDGGRERGTGQGGDPYESSVCHSVDLRNFVVVSLKSLL